MSPELDRDPRDLAEVVRNAFMSADTYIIVSLHDGLPYLNETQTGQTLSEVVTEIAKGNHEAAVGVVRASMADNEYEDVTRKAALLIAGEIFCDADEPEDLVCPFLNRAWPRWKDEWIRQYEAEMAGMAEDRLYARTGT